MANSGKNGICTLMTRKYDTRNYRLRLRHKLNQFISSRRDHMTLLPPKERWGEREILLRNFDPDQVGIPNGNIFGFPYDPACAEIIIDPYACAITNSEGDLAQYGPPAIIGASTLIDHYDQAFKDVAIDMGAALLAPNKLLDKLRSLNLRARAQACIDHQTQGKAFHDPLLQSELAFINHACRELHDSIKKRARPFLENGQIAAVLGGGHDCPLGLMEAVSELFHDWGILHFDTHLDRRRDKNRKPGYEGLHYSHASIMAHASNLPYLRSIVHIGQRDFSRQEHMEVLDSPNRYHLYSAMSIYTMCDIERTRTFRSICQEISEQLPECIYLSMDIDGLDMSQCLPTGTPMAGGIPFSHIAYLLHYLAQRHYIVAFDLCEAAPLSSDENSWEKDPYIKTAVKFLFLLCSAAAHSQQRRLRL